MLTKRGRRVMNVDDTVVTRFPACQNARRSGVAPAGGRRRHRRWSHCLTGKRTDRSEQLDPPLRPQLKLPVPKPASSGTWPCPGVERRVRNDRTHLGGCREACHERRDRGGACPRFQRVPRAGAPARRERDGSCHVRDGSSTCRQTVA